VFGCGAESPDSESFPTGVEFESKGEALLGAETTVASSASYEYSEPFAISVYSSTNSRWETVVPFVNLGVTGSWTYSCTTDYTTWSTKTYTTSNQGPDPTGVYRNANTNRAVIMTMIDGGTGLRVRQSPGPCATSATWIQNDFTLNTNGTFDYPSAAYYGITDTVYVAFTQNTASDRWLNVLKFNSNLSGGTYWYSNCSNITGFIGQINAETDSSGNIHLVYNHYSDNTVRHEVFYTATNTFACLNNVVAPLSFPTGTCGSCSGTATYQGLESNCLKAVNTPSIAIDRGTSPNNLVITTNKPGTGSCAGKDELRVYRSTNSGSSWSWVLVTGCQNSIQPRAAWTGQAGKFHILSSHVPSGSNQLWTADWLSTNGGANWGGAYMYYRPATRPAGGCWWGDYSAAVADPGHNRMFYGWGTIPAGAPHYQIHGVTNDR
jgi:hypothetical protein